jgi:hypothetical protein
MTRSAPVLIGHCAVYADIRDGRAVEVLLVDVHDAPVVRKQNRLAPRLPRLGEQLRSARASVIANGPVTVVRIEAA